jgi:hypothetical protein
LSIVSRKRNGFLRLFKTKGHFVKVGCQMLCAYFMPRAHIAALQERERGFNRVRVDVAHDVYHR